MPTDSKSEAQIHEDVRREFVAASLAFEKNGGGAKAWQNLKTAMIRMQRLSNGTDPYAVIEVEDILN